MTILYLLLIYLFDNAIAIRLYERLGFRRTRTSYKAVGAAVSTIGV